VQESQKLLDRHVGQFIILYVLAERISMAPFCHKQHLVLRQSAEWDLTRTCLLFGIQDTPTRKQIIESGIFQLDDPEVYSI
jgi:hypothetical protein